ncbi:MAG: esterase [Lachnospiraceae bacterium]|nr:esterase [Lachnospiraceae bacterium]
MNRYEFGNKDSSNILIQPVDDRDLTWMDNEIAAIRQAAGSDFALIAYGVPDWNNDLSPWEAPAVFGDKAFGCGGKITLDRILSDIKNDKVKDDSKRYYLGGYSLAGLFAIWAGYQTDMFRGIAAASPSIWFPGFSDYMKKEEFKSDKIYLSLGDREEKTRNPVTSRVGDCIRAAEKHFLDKGIDTVLEWNKGNHFKDVDLRTARAFAWLLEKDGRTGCPNKDPS